MEELEGVNKEKKSRRKKNLGDMKAKITVSRAVHLNESPCSKLQGIKAV